MRDDCECDSVNGEFATSLQRDSAVRDGDERPLQNGMNAENATKT